MMAMRMVVLVCGVVVVMVVAVMPAVVVVMVAGIVDRFRAGEPGRPLPSAAEARRPERSLEAAQGGVGQCGSVARGAAS